MLENTYENERKRADIQLGNDRQKTANVVDNPHFIWIGQCSVRSFLGFRC